MLLSFSQSLKLIFPAIIGTLIFSIGILVYLHGRKSVVNKIFFGLTLTTVFWIIAVVARFNIQNENIILLSTRLSYVAAALIGFFVNYFCYNFPSKNKYKLRFYLLEITTTIFVYISIFTPYIIERIDIVNGAQKNVFGSLYLLYLIYFPVMVIWGIYNLLIKYHSLNKDEASQVKFIFTGITLSFIFGVSTNLIFPWLAQSSLTEQYGPLGVVLLVFFAAYAIIKHQLLNVKVITTEIFALAISFILLINTVFAESLTQLILRAVLFVAVTIFSWLLIKGVLNEVKAKEQLAELTKELQKANEDLKKLDKAKSEFISIASHQLRTPLSVIKGYISMLLEGSYGEVPEKAKDVLSKMEANNQRLNNLIDDLLDLSRIEGGRMQFDWAFISFAELIQSVVDDLKIVAEKKGLTFKWINEAPEKMFVRADKEKLRQVVLNLIDNSIKYTPQGSIEVKLTKTEENKARLTIKDTGIGMDQEELAMLFGKFVRGKKTPRLWTEGSGLGLYVAKKIIEEHKGNVWAESKGEGKGSTFFVELPVY